ncbi:SDR family oxidoreductase [Ferdinandcohnia quinoae]|uniref:SDR family NAD(P)-dependent oxidoreductase n=1 Tax=Fredinandcohnia quinoae TaxID=2918902 RepID=A0AAW5EE80_9BACI|nr:SDR family NAD(P)-dependent oxidoreductase [Fredinandcohnia sp. SECRCQ15]MCH1627791.1 SDR family NAD(P)-dependent oxidoreductase [Fredinandcohnia sp. SECRCQ15]
MRTSGHTVLITGGASGIGLALTQQFLNNENQVIVVGRNECKLSEVSQRHPNVKVFACDISKDDEVDVLVSELTEKHPNLNVIVNNAGIQHNYSFLDNVSENTVGKVKNEIDINLVAPILLTTKLLPLLYKHDQAAIVNVSSGLGLIPKKSAPVYCATKAGLHLFSKSLRYQLEQSPIKVFEIIPALVDTEMTKGRGRGKISPEALAEEFWKAFRRDQEEVAIGKVKLLKWICRLAPSYAEAMLKNS